MKYRENLFLPILLRICYFSCIVFSIYNLKLNINFFSICIILFLFLFLMVTDKSLEVTDENLIIEIRRWCPFFHRKKRIINYNTFSNLDFEKDYYQTRIMNKIIFRINNSSNIVIKTYLSEEVLLEMKKKIMKIKKAKNIE